MTSELRAGGGSCQWPLWLSGGHGRGPEERIKYLQCADTWVSRRNTVHIPGIAIGASKSITSGEVWQLVPASHAIRDSARVN